MENEIVKQTKEQIQKEIIKALPRRMDLPSRFLYPVITLDMATYPALTVLDVVRNITNPPMTEQEYNDFMDSLEEEEDYDANTLSKEFKND